MSNERLRRLAYQWGGLALAVQLWIDLGFVHQLRRYLEFVAKEVKLEVVPARISQLRPPALKVPWSYCYLGVFLAVALGCLGVLWVRALRRAMTPDDDAR